jgi:hypothetical protein
MHLRSKAALEPVFGILLQTIGSGEAAWAMRWGAGVTGGSTVVGSFQFTTPS